MRKVFVLGSGLLLSVALAGGQNSNNSGTVNSMSTDPQQNQKATGTMGTTTGQPNDVTPGSSQNYSGGVPSTSTMTGSGSDGKMPASSAPPNSGAVTGNSSQLPNSDPSSKNDKKEQRKPKAPSSGTPSRTAPSSSVPPQVSAIDHLPKCEAGMHPFYDGQQFGGTWGCIADEVNDVNKPAPDCEYTLLKTTCGLRANHKT